MSETLTELRRRLGDIYQLGRASALLGWDERTKMPPAGAEPRAEVLATIARMRHELFCEERIGELLASARDELGEAEPGESADHDLVRLTSRDWEKARRVPAELQEEMARQATMGEHAWVRAREDSDFSSFAPQLERNVALAREFAACYDGFPGFEETYDALLDEYEPGMRTAELRPVLEELREGLVPLVADLPADPDAGAPVAGGPPTGSNGAASPLYGDFPVERQRELVARVLGELPLPEGAWRLDDTTHPFATSIAISDIRLTTRYDQRYLGTALWSAMHESGHGMYEAGVDPALDGTALAKPRSLGLHESQSRLWENWVGRGLPFLTHLLPILRDSFPDEFADLDADGLHRAANRAARSLIRVEADELTYNLHITIRFELELELFSGELDVPALPEAWNARYRDYLGLAVPDDARGVLQDVHWAGGAFGYFPTYSLGNVIAGQLWKAAERDLSGLDAQLSGGDTGPLGEWLRDRVHRHGRRLTPAEVLERAGCGPLDVGPLLDHLRERAAI